MKKRRIAALALSAVMLVSAAAGCSTKTKSEVTGSETTSTGSETTTQTGATGEVTLNLLYSSGDEVIANVIRDQLNKAGINVEMSAASDGATFREQEGNGNFDISVASWANPVGTPDYGCRGIWHSNGDSNLTGIADPKLDELVETAAEQMPENYAEYYGAAEKYAIEEMCYMTPLYNNVLGRAFNVMLEKDSVTNNQRWEDFAYVDDSLTETRPLTIAQTGSTITTWDPIRADDLSSGYALDEMYIHLVTLQPDWSVSTKESLSYSYAVSEDSTKYYFLLRDDCFFARIDENGEVYNSGVMVSGEDVVYSLERAMDPDSTPLHKTYSMYQNMASVEVVTDIAELESTKTAEGTSILEALEAEGQSVTSLVATRDEVDNAAGSYQVVCCTTSVPYPQILNCLSFHGAGIVDSEFVEAMNADVDIANYDATKDSLYGDSVCTVEGDTYANHLSLSGSYVLTSMNDYQMNFTANPYIRMNDTERNPITKLVDKFITDTEACLSALRSGEIEFSYLIPETKYDIVEQDENLDINTFPGIRVYMLAFNMHGNSEVSNSLDLRKAVASAINFADIEAVKSGNALECYSPLATCLDCGNVLPYQDGDTAKYLEAYFASKES